MNKSAVVFGISKLLTGKTVIITTLNWPIADSIIALQIAIIATITVNHLTEPPEKEFLDKIFNGVERK